jgi:large subunit ribosomal protein L24
MKIKKDDKVIVTSGKNKGTEGIILKVFPATEKVLINGVNVIKRHMKANKATGTKGEIIEKSMPIHISNVMLLDPVDNKPTRVGYKEVDGKKVRFAKKSGQVIK